MKRNAIAFLFATVLTATGLNAGAQENALPKASELPDGAKSCIDISRIYDTDIKDDETIIFRLRGGNDYINHLPYKCHGLRIHNGFSYSTSLPRLCHQDIITVIDRGTSCGLGYFIPYDDDQKDDDNRKKEQQESTQNGSQEK